MKAVNLIPGEQRGSSAGRSGVAAYAVLGGLAVLVLMVAAWGLSGHNVSKRQAELAGVQREADAAAAQATRLAPYSAFASIRTKRVQTVTDIANSRFDWAHVMHEVARTIPSDAWLTSVIGSTSPAVQIQGGGGGGGQSLRGTQNVPAAEIVGCTENQSQVSRMMARLRLIDQVQRVTLVESAKREDGGAGTPDTGGGSGGSTGGSDGDCRPNSKIPKFDVLIFFAPIQASPAPAAPGATPAPATGSAPAGATASASNPPAPASTPAPR